MKKVRVAHTIIFEHEFPDDWNKETIEFHLNEGSWCANNLLDMWEKIDDSRYCVCTKHKAEIVNDTILDGTPLIKI